MSIRKTMLMLAALGCAAALSAAPAAATAPTIKGKITTQDGVSRSGEIRWSAKEKAYLTTRKAGATMIDEITKPEDVAEMDIEKPAQWDAIVKAVEAGKGVSVQKRLEAIVKDYAHLQWDKSAGRYLAQTYVMSGNYDKALAVCRDIIANDETAAYAGDLAPMYWQALLKKGQNAKLEAAIKKAIATGDRYSSGAALIMRGDMEVEGKAGDRDAAMRALQDGYMRVVLLYTDEGVAGKLRPEAMSKAAKCFETLGQAPRAADLRGQLRAQYADSPWNGR